MSRRALWTLIVVLACVAVASGFAIIPGGNLLIPAAAQVQQRPIQQRPGQRPKAPNTRALGAAQAARPAANQATASRRAVVQGVPAGVSDIDGVPVLSFGDSYDDFVSVTQTSDGTTYAAYASYFDAHDQIRLHKLLPNGHWSSRTHVPVVRARADIWMPQLAVDANDRLWVVWCEQTDQTLTASGNWDLYARSLKDNTWGPIIRLTENAKPDINPHVTVDGSNNIHVVWQANPANYGTVQYCHYDGRKWSKPLTVTSTTESDWYPQAAVDDEGALDLTGR